MGGSESTDASSSQIDHQIQAKIIKFEQFQNIHNHLKTYEDGRYGKVSLYSRKTDPAKLYLLKEKWASNSVAKTQFRALLKHMCKEEHEFLQRIAYIGEEEQNTFCSDFSKFFVAFPFAPWTLKRKISIWDRKRTPDGRRKKVIFLLKKCNFEFSVF